MKTTNPVIGKILYAFLFLVVIPAILLFWAVLTGPVVTGPVVESAVAGWVLLSIGGLLMLWGMFALQKYGKGLPMNAFPPPKFVSEGPYRLLRHPIYWGFGLFMVGFFILTKMPSGLWLVTPVTICGMVAMVWGFEKIDLQNRFPKKHLHTVLDLPSSSSLSATWRDRMISLFWVGAAFLLVNFLTHAWCRNYPVFTGLHFKNSVLGDGYITFLSLLLILITPLLLKRKSLMRDWVLWVIFASGLSVFLGILFPPLGVAGLLKADATNGFGVVRLIPMISVPVYLLLISIKAVFRQSIRLGIPFMVIAGAATLIQLTIIRSIEIYVIFSTGIFLIASNYRQIWLLLRNASEQVANSWKEWEFGRIRVINHGFYVGFGAFLGILISGLLVGKIYAWAILVFAVIVIVFSALWAQIIEGSEKLKRPYGYYGALVGILFASLGVWAMGFQVWVLIGVISVVMPWVQAIGRLRCLVNGCCHGSPVDSGIIGIRYLHYRSRVCGISDLKGVWLHPTPLYSILWLFLTGLIMFGLWTRHLPFPFIFGLYLILTGIGRFVEEAYRGEVQTPIIKGLRLYQWTAILTVLIGIIISAIPLKPQWMTPDYGWETILAAIIGGLFTTFAMGVDFPHSNARFSRLV